MCFTKISVGSSPAVGILFLFITWNCCIDNKTPNFAFIYIVIYVSCMVRIGNRILKLVQLNRNVFYNLGTWQLYVVGEAQTHANFGEGDVMIKSYIFWAPIATRGALRNSVIVFLSFCRFVVLSSLSFCRFVVLSFCRLSSLSFCHLSPLSFYRPSPRIKALLAIKPCVTQPSWLLRLSSLI